mgnify:CR=1 FL=1
MIETFSKKPKKSIVLIPCYNEAQNIRKLIPAIFKFEKNIDILIINDDSEDDTKEVAQKLAKKYIATLKNKNRIFVLNRIKKRGFGFSYIDGFKWALAKDYDFILQMDGDFSHHPKYLPVFLKQMKNYDLVIGSRYFKKKINTKNWNTKRLILSILANFYAKVITRLPINDLTGGFKCFKRLVLETIDLDKISAKGFAFHIEMNWLVYKAGFKIGEIPITFFSRKHGKSKLSFNIIKEGLWIPIKIIIKNSHFLF